MFLTLKLPASLVNLARVVNSAFFVFFTSYIAVSMLVPLPLKPHVHSPEME